MTSTDKAWKRTSGMYVASTAASCVYFYLSVRYPTPPASMAVLASRLSIVVPEIVIWFLATLCAVHFKRYTLSITHSPDGVGLNNIANAVLLMVAYAIMLSMRTTIASLFVHTRYLMIAVFLRNELPLLTILVSTILLYIGARQLIQLTQQRVWNMKRRVAVTTITGTCLLSYTYYFAKVEPHAPAVAGVPRFVQPLHLLMVTYVLPHCVTWILGILACANLAHYAAHSPGIIYRHLFRNIYVGVFLVLFVTFVAQFGIVSRFAGIHEESIQLLAPYGLLAIGGAGFMILRNGTHALQALERVLP